MPEPVGTSGTGLAQVWDALLARPRLAALALGLLSATGFQPIGLWPVALAAMALFVALLAQAADPRRAAMLGWLFGWAHFTLGNNWIATAFTYQANMPAVLGWAAVPLLAVYLAVYPALAALGAHALAGRGGRPGLGWAMVLAFAGCWTISELMRAAVFTGYAWNPFAMLLLGPFDRPGLAAIAPWTGTYALSGLAVLVAGCFAVALSLRRYFAAGAAAALLAGGMLLPAGPAGRGTVPFTLVQPDLRQEVLNDLLYQQANFAKLARLSQPRHPGSTRLVLWPESGLSEYLRPGYPQRFYDQMTTLGDPAFARRRIGRVIGPGSLLMSGAVDLKIADGDAVGAYNSVTAIGDDGAIRAGYSKAHLVPYGEYLPLRWMLEPLGVSRLVPGAIDFLPGPGPRTLNLGPYGRAGVQICYEIVFSGEVAARGAQRPDYIFNPSNDGWFGTFGPPQHLAQARMRAIEEGLPVLRSTTTGISAVIDARGVVRQYLSRHVAGRLDGMVPAAAPPTLFAQMGNALSFCWAFLFLIGAVVALRLGRR
ncbi:MAG: hypothetical protein RLZZ08_13 [Pseudomonadota bacterium]|jgi:apolipoprotein N-acyltransferase